MSKHGSFSSKLDILHGIAVDLCRTVGSIILGGLGIVLLSIWHWVLPGQSGATDSSSSAISDESDPEIVEYELGWYHYLKAFDAHHGPGGSPEREVTSGSFIRGLQTWISTRFLRGYTLGDEVYVCPNAPRVLRVHQAGHAPSFGSRFPTLANPRRDNGGLEDEPLSTFDVMLPGEFPHTFLRFRDSRGLREAYDEWLQMGRIVRTGI